MTTTHPTPEAIAADIHATAQAHKAGVIDADEAQRRTTLAWTTATMSAMRRETRDALATIEADARPFGPGTLDVLLNAENERTGRIADAIDALAGVSIESEGATYTTRLGGIVVSRKTLAALVRALRGGSQ